MLVALFALLSSLSAHAEFNANIKCEANGSLIAFNNESIMKWKTTTQNQFLARGHVAGHIIAMYPERNGHVHFLIKIGPQLSTGNACDDDTLEVVYNKEFGAIDPNDMKLGTEVQACGDYITSSQDTQRYVKSPGCAIVHWVHMNLRHDGHEDGYLMINGHMYGNNPTATAAGNYGQNGNQNRNNQNGNYNNQNRNNGNYRRH